MKKPWPARTDSPCAAQGCARTPRPVLGGLNGQSIARRIAAAATAAGIVGSLGTPGASALLPN